MSIGDDTISETGSRTRHKRSHSLMYAIKQEHAHMHDENTDMVTYQIKHMNHTHTNPVTRHRNTQKSRASKHMEGNKNNNEMTQNPFWKMQVRSQKRPIETKKEQ